MSEKQPTLSTYFRGFAVSEQKVQSSSSAIKHEWESSEVNVISEIFYDVFRKCFGYIFLGKFLDVLPCC